MNIGDLANSSKSVEKVLEETQSSEVATMFGFTPLFL
jgi:hypothetical protein